jgi:hypothetical protein
MSLYCSAYGGDDWGDWHWYPPQDEAPLATKRSRRCCSCKTIIKVGDIARKIERCRPATEWEETRGFGTEMWLADWYLCETCGDLADSLEELGYCYEIGESLQSQIKEYRDEGGKL